jgi:hypothetical protein
MAPAAPPVLGGGGDGLTLVVDELLVWLDELVRGAGDDVCGAVDVRGAADERVGVAGLETLRDFDELDDLEAAPTSAAAVVRCVVAGFDRLVECVLGPVGVLPAGELCEPPRSRNPAPAISAANAMAARTRTTPRRLRRESPSYGSSSHGA